MGKQETLPQSPGSFNDFLEKTGLDPSTSEAIGQYTLALTNFRRELATPPGQLEPTSSDMLRLHDGQASQRSTLEVTAG